MRQSKFLFHCPAVSFMLLTQINKMSAMGTSWTVWESNPCVDEIYRNRPDRPRGPPSLLYHRYRVFPGGKEAKAWRWPPTPSSAEVKRKSRAISLLPSGPSWPVVVWTLPLPCRQWFPSARRHVSYVTNPISRLRYAVWPANSTVWVVTLRYSSGRGLLLSTLSLILPQFVSEHGIFSRTKILRIHISTEMKFHCPVGVWTILPSWTAWRRQFAEFSLASRFVWQCSWTTAVSYGCQSSAGICAENCGQVC